MNQTEMEPKLPVYHQETVIHNAGPSAPGYQQPYQQMNTVQAPEVQHHDSNRSNFIVNSNDTDEDDEQVIDESKIILPIDSGDVPQQKYLSLEFNATFHEHKKTGLVKPVHEVLGIIYKWIKLITYHFFVFLIGIPLMIIWAFVNGIMAFIYSWLYSPALRVTLFWTAAALPLATMPLVTFFRPLVDVAARCLSQVRFKGGVEGKGFVQNV